MRTTGFLTVMLMILITMTAKAQVGGFDPENPGDPQVPVLKYNLTIETEPSNTGQFYVDDDYYKACLKFVKQFEYVEFYKLTALVILKRSASDKHVKLLAADAVRKGAFALFCRKVRKQVVYHKLRLAGVFTY